VYNGLVARLCSVCQHPQLSEINLAVADPAARLSRIAVAFGLARSSLKRHVSKCVSRAIAKSLKAQELVTGSSILAEVSAIRGKIATNLDNCGEAATIRSNSDYNRTIASYLATTEHVARLAGLPGYQPASQQPIAIDARGSRFLIMPQSPQNQPLSLPSGDDSES
jgi:hypothetical protein